MIKKPTTIWITGLPCSGKTTIARELEKNEKNWNQCNSLGWKCY